VVERSTGRGVRVRLVVYSEWELKRERRRRLLAIAPPSTERYTPRQTASRPHALLPTRGTIDESRSQYGRARNCRASRGDRLRMRFVLSRSHSRVVARIDARGAPRASGVAHVGIRAVALSIGGTLTAGTGSLRGATRTELRRSSCGGRALAGESLCSGGAAHRDAGIRRVTHRPNWTHQSYRARGAHDAHVAHRGAQLETGGRKSRSVTRIESTSTRVVCFRDVRASYYL
jgi:hypothetical protein